jgi:hypothetical protein
MEHRPRIADVQRLIGEVAKRHNMLLGPDDPIFIGVTLNELVLARAMEQVQASVAAMLAEHALVSAQHREAAKAVAEQLITGASDYVAKEVKGGRRQAGRDAATLAKSLNPGGQRRGPPASRTAGRAAGIAVAAVCLITGAVLASWFQGTGHGRCRRRDATAR